MEENNRYLAFVARVVVPASLLSAGLWFTGLFGMQSSVFSIPGIAAAYVAGYAALSYSGSALGTNRGPRFYTFFVGLAAAGALVGIGLLGTSISSALDSMMVPAVLAFILPVLVEAGMGLIKNAKNE